MGKVLSTIVLTALAFVVMILMVWAKKRLFPMELSGFHSFIIYFGMVAMLGVAVAIVVAAINELDE